MLYVQYYLTEEFCSQEFIQTGERPSMLQTFELDEKQLGEQDRAHLVLLGWDKLVDDGKIRMFGREKPMLKTFELVAGNGMLGRPRVEGRNVQLSYYASLHDILFYIGRMVGSKEAAELRLPGATAEWEQAREAHRRQREEENRQRSEAEAARRAEKERLKEERRQQFADIQWDDDGKTAWDLYEALFAVAQVDRDSNKKGHFAKRVTGIDRSKKDGYMFLGEWVGRGLQEIEKGYKVYIVAGVTGSRKYPTTEYAVVIMDEDGTLRQTDIVTNTDVPGSWAMRIRERVEQALSYAPVQE